MRRVIVLLLVAVLSTACATGSEAVSTSSTEATTSSQSETTTTTTVTDSSIASTTTTTSPDDLAGYLAEAYVIVSDLVVGQVDVAAANAGLDALADCWRECRMRLEALVPPAEATEFHQRWLVMVSDFIDAMDTAMDDLAAGQPNAAEMFTAAFADQGAEVIALDALQNQLARQVFASRNDPVAHYLGKVMGLQSDAQPVMELFFLALGGAYTDPVGAIEDMFSATGDLRGIGDRWAGLDPPAQASSLHDRQIELFDEVVATFEEMGELLQANIAPSDQFLLEMTALSQRSQEQNAEWGRFIAKALDPGVEVTTPTRVTTTTTELRECVPETLTTDGWVTDTVNVVTSDAELEQAVEDLVAQYGHEIAVVLIADSGLCSPNDFAVELGDAWGVGDPERNDGIVVLVDLGNRRTAIETGPGVDVTSEHLDRVAGMADDHFRAGDFDSGILAILGELASVFE